jgi:trans-2,3-dihydro-3-hydroxyanthranilate isomerase
MVGPPYPWAMALSYLHYDVFTGSPLLGNQLAVFTDARGLDTAAMQRLAREMNFSESTFILPAEQSGTDIRLRIFTPMNELPMAGHPTIGSTFALAHTGVIRPGSSRFVFGLNIGPVPVDLEWKGDALRFAWMTQSTPTFGRILDDRAAVAATLGLSSDDLAEGLPVQEVSCGVPYLLVPLRDRQTVDRAVSDTAAFRRFMAAAGVDLAIFLFSVEPNGLAETAYSRMFAPEFGIIEDPATGSASGPLGCYLVRYGVVTGDAAQRMISLQGVAMGRSSRIHIHIDGRSDNISRVRVGGEAILVGKGEMLV